MARTGEPMNLFTRLFRTAAAPAVLRLSSAASGAHADLGAKPGRFTRQADLRRIDPIWTTAYVSRNFGYLVFDTLFGLAKDSNRRPQMVHLRPAGAASPRNKLS